MLAIAYASFYNYVPLGYCFILDWSQKYMAHIIVIGFELNTSKNVF